MAEWFDRVQARSEDGSSPYSFAIRTRSVFHQTIFVETGPSMPGSNMSLFENCGAGQIMKKIAVIIPSYNNRQWYDRNLSSVIAQDYQNFRVTYVDDCSSDGTGELVAQFIADRGPGNLIHLIRNPVRLGALHNLFNTIRACDNDEIVVLLDGDDWLAHNGVLKKINEVYANPDCWMTYGQYRSCPDNVTAYSREIPSDIINANEFRQTEWCSSHLRSFYAWLFKLIKTEDLLDPSGTFYSMAWDQAIMFPMLEMSGHRAKFIDEVLYIYNAANPINDCKVDRQLQQRLETIIRRQKPYDRLNARVGVSMPYRSHD
jgi:glycosyltransferase involved in cell wall biosynthesis